MGARGEVSFTERVARRHGIGIEGAAEPDAVMPGRAAEHAQRLALAVAERGRERVDVVGLLEGGNCAHRLIEKRDLHREHVAEQAGNAQRHIDARAVQRGEGQDVEAGHARAAGIPARAHAEMGHRLGEIFARRAHGGAGP